MVRRHLFFMVFGLSFFCLSLFAMYTHDDVRFHITDDHDDVQFHVMHDELRNAYCDILRDDFGIKVTDGVPQYPDTFLLAVENIDNQRVDISLRLWTFFIIERTVEQGFFYQEALKAALQCVYNNHFEIKKAVLSLLCVLASKGQVNESVLLRINHYFQDENQEIRIHALNLFAKQVQSDKLSKKP